MVHVDNKGFIDGLWRREMKCIGPRARDADMWILILEGCTEFTQEGKLVEVEHVQSGRHQEGNAATVILRKVTSSRKAMKRKMR